MSKSGNDTKNMKKSYLWIQNWSNMDQFPSKTVSFPLSLPLPCPPTENIYMNATYSDIWSFWGKIVTHAVLSLSRIMKFLVTNTKICFRATVLSQKGHIQMEYNWFSPSLRCKKQAQYPSLKVLKHVLELVGLKKLDFESFGPENKHQTCHMRFKEQYIITISPFSVTLSHA